MTAPKPLTPHDMFNKAVTLAEEASLATDPAIGLLKATLAAAYAQLVTASTVLSSSPPAGLPRDPGEQSVSVDVQPVDAGSIAGSTLTWPDAERRM